MLPDDRKFHDSIAAKTYKATKADREAQTKDLKSKLEELKQPDEVKMRLVNEPSDLAAAFFAMLHGKDGDDGKTPEKGKDYFTDDEAQDFLKRATPEKGVHYMTPDEVSEMLRQATPIKGTHYFDGDKGDKGNPGRDGADGVGLKGDKGNPGAPGKRGSPDTGADIKEKLSGLSGSERLHISSIDGIGEFGESFLQQAKALVPRSLSGMYDMNLRGLADGDTIVWNQATHKWIPGTGGGSGSLVIGTTPITGGSVGDVLKIGAGGILASGAVSGTGTVTSVSVVTANGVSGSVATATTTPAITLTLGAITPSSVAATGLISATVNSTTSVGYSFAADSTTGLGYVTGNLLLYQSGKLSLVLTDALLNFRIPSNYTYSWAGNIANNVGADTGMSRLSAGSLAVGNGTSGDTSGSLTAASFVGALTGNASTATKLATVRTIAGTSFDGSANIALANKFIVQGTTDAGLSGAQFLGALATGIVKNTTSTGVLSIAVAGDFPTLNQSTTGSAATLTTPRAINGVNFDGSAPITVTAAAGTLTGTTLNSTVVTSSLTALGTVTTGGLGTGAALGSVTVSIASTAVGDIFYAGASNVLTRLADVAAGQPLLSGGVTTAPAYAGYTLSGTAAQTYTFPGTSATLAGIATTQTLTNKRVTKRVVSTTQSATPSVNTDNGDIFEITALAQAITSMTTNLTGTPVDGDVMMVQITDNGTARAITWGAKFASFAAALPASTVVSTMLPVLFQWSAASSVWNCMSTPVTTGTGTVTSVSVVTSQGVSGSVATSTSTPAITLTLGALTGITSLNTMVVSSGGKITNYGGVATAGWGVPAVNGYGRSTAQTSAVASVATYTVGASDGSFIITANLNLTAVTTASISVSVTYTDETNTSRTLTMNTTNLGGTFLTAVGAVQGVGAYSFVAQHIRAKASTSVTIATTGTFTSVTYNVEAAITQIA